MQEGFESSLFSALAGNNDLSEEMVLYFGLKVSVKA